MKNDNPAAEERTEQTLADTAEAAAEDYAVAADSRGADQRQPAQRERWSKRYMSLVFLAQFATYIALIAPSNFSLAVKVAAINPADKDALLAVVLTITGVAVIVVNPITGILSDVTRSRFGRRRPWMIGGLIAGLIGYVILGLATGIPLLITGWVIGYLGLNTVTSMIINHLGDALPEAQRGRVAGINGAVTQVAAIIGVALAGGLVGTGVPVLLFVVPAIVAVVGTLAFVIRMKDPSTRNAEFERVKLLGIFSRMVFNPRKYRDFAWTWSSKLATFVSLYMMAIYTVYFLTERLGIGVTAVAALSASVGAVSIFATMAGALGSGFISDRIHRRKPLLVLGGVVMAGGLLIVGTSTSITQYVAGALLGTLGSGIFGAIDQALSLDVLPDGESQGRFLGIMGLASEIPKALAPLIAGVVVIIGVAPGHSNYQLVYFVAGACALLGGLLVLPIKKIR